ncbi:hypothetical protein LZK73_02440 [Neorhizobium galegae]|nr:hypothetical protein LZK73_02440 [Neorhizobium galegae]
MAACLVVLPAALKQADYPPIVERVSHALPEFSVVCISAKHRIVAAQPFPSKENIQRRAAEPSEVTDWLQSEDLSFMAYSIARRRKSKAQILQDLWVCYEFGEKSGGFFVEFGATNGLINSNTWLLENELNWRGIWRSQIPSGMPHLLETGRFISNIYACLPSRKKS